MYKRILDLNSLLAKKSFFLFGPRSTGKTTLIREQLPNIKVYDLLKAKTYRDLVKNPSLIEQEYTDQKIIVIDEVQKLPSILDEVHRLIEEKGIRFLLTGSSARKLKHGGANLLAGRAWSASLFPLISKEVDDFDLLKCLNFGMLPQVYTSEDPEEELESYVSTYLQEEIKAEAVTRNIQAFSEFLDIIALANGNEISYQSLASDCQVSPNTLKNYIQILEDTLLGFSLPAFTKTKKRKAITRSKFYLFDIGVTNYLTNRSHIKEKSKEFGDVFEHFIILEIRAYLSYVRNKSQLCYWRSTSKFEVDLIIGQQIAIEIKGTDQVQDKHLKGLRAIKEEDLFSSLIVISNDKSKRTFKDGIEVYPWKVFIEDLWSGKIINKER
jgi:predicted AAA+ superfamily ATPase